MRELSALCALCPTRAIKIVKTDCCLRENDNWQKSDTIKEIYKQAATGGVLLSSMGNPDASPVYWDRILINASQVTNPSIDPLREPMETRVFLGKKPKPSARTPTAARYDATAAAGACPCPFVFGYELRLHQLQRPCGAGPRREELGICYNTGEGGLHGISTPTAQTPSYRWPPAASAS